MKSEKVKEIKDSIQRKINRAEKGKDDFVNCVSVDMLKMYLTYINELESENDTLHTNLCEWRKENQQLKDRIENQRMTKKGFRYEILPSTEHSSRRVKDYNEYCTLYNRLAELEDKIENGLLVPRYSILKDWQYGDWCVCELDDSNLILAQYKTEAEAEARLKELQEKQK